MTSNPAIDDLECSTHSSLIEEKRGNPIGDIGDAIEKALSEQHFDQKTNITSENEDGLICIDILQAHFLRSFKYEFPSLAELKRSKQEHAVSVNGKRSDQIVEILKTIQSQIISSDLPLGNRLMRPR